MQDCASKQATLTWGQECCFSNNKSALPKVLRQSEQSQQLEAAHAMPGTGFSCVSETSGDSILAAFSPCKLAKSGYICPQRQGFFCCLFSAVSA
jgi:hypothetical protein